jgi:HSP20 family protein
VKFHISESGEQLTAHAEVPGFNRQEIKVSLEPRRLSISGKAELREDHHFGKHTHSLRHAQLMFRVIDLPCEVDLSKAKATFNDGTLEVVMPKAAPAKSVRVETKLGSSAEGDTSIHETGGIEAAGRQLAGCHWSQQADRQGASSIVEEIASARRHHSAVACCPGLLAEQCSLAAKALTFQRLQSLADPGGFRCPQRAW